MKERLFYRRWRAILLIASLIGCEQLKDGQQRFEELKPPIILVAKSADGDIIVRDKDSTYLSLYNGYYLAQSISQTYSIGDTLK